MIRFEFATSTRVIFGAGALAEVGLLARDLGRHALIVTGRSSERGERVRTRLVGEGLAATRFAVAHEPTLSVVEEGTAVARAAGCDLVIGIGGGSALDTAKAIAALVSNGGSLVERLEVIGRAAPLTQPSLPCVAIPTTAGTGSEVTRNAVLSSPAHRIKVSLRSPLMLPRLALVDPELTFDLPPEVTATTGLDALTQLVEPYVSSRANPLVDALCIQAIPRAAGALRRACRDGSDRRAREDMSLASLFSGMALANAGLGAVHGLAGPIGGMFEAPHGAVCAALLPHVVAANLRALETRAAGHASRPRFDALAHLLTGRVSATAADGVAWLRDLVGELRIPPLASYGITTGDIGALVEQGTRASSMRGNPLELSAAELTEILAAAL